MNTLATRISFLHFRLNRAWVRSVTLFRGKTCSKALPWPRVSDQSSWSHQDQLLCLRGSTEESTPDPTKHSISGTTPPAGPASIQNHRYTTQPVTFLGFTHHWGVVPVSCLGSYKWYRLSSRSSCLLLISTSNPKIHFTPLKEVQENSAWIQNKTVEGIFVCLFVWGQLCKYFPLLHPKMRPFVSTALSDVSTSLYVWQWRLDWQSIVWCFFPS